MELENLQLRGVLLILIITGQVSTVLAAGACGAVWTFLLSSFMSQLVSPSEKRLDLD